MKHSALIAVSFLLSAPAFAESRRVVCEFRDNIFRYVDVIVLNEGGFARVESTVHTSDLHETSYTCLAESAVYREESGLVRISGQTSCVDGSAGKFEKTLDLNRMELNGGWQGAVPCRAAE